MRITHLVTSAAVIASLAFAAPAFAQHRGGGSARPSGSARSAGRAAPRSAPAPVQRVAPSGPRSIAPSGRYVAPSRSFSGGVVGRAVPAPRGYVRVAPRVIGRSYYAPRYGAYRVYSPYYSFRPHFSLGFGLYAGYPVVYPSWAYPYYDPYYYDDYPYPYSYSAPYPSAPYSSAPYPGYSSAPSSVPVPGSVQAQPGVAAGGVSFEITPSNAEVLVDGNDYGVVSDFTPTSAPLSLAPGRHHVEIRAPGYETMAFDTDIVAGQVIPYQGTMQRLR